MNLRKKTIENWSKLNNLKKRTKTFTLREARLIEAESAIIKGYYSIETIRSFASKWGLTYRQTSKYFAIARDKIHDSWNLVDREKLISRQMARLEFLYAIQFKNENYKECRELIKDQNALIGIGNTSRIQLNVTSKEENRNELLEKYADLAKSLNDSKIEVENEFNSRAN